MRVRLKFALFKQLLERLVEYIEFDLKVVFILNLSKIFLFNCCLVVKLHIILRHELESNSRWQHSVSFYQNAQQNFFIGDVCLKLLFGLGWRWFTQFHLHVQWLLKCQFEAVFKARVQLLNLIEVHLVQLFNVVVFSCVLALDQEHVLQSLR